MQGIFLLAQALSVISNRYIWFECGGSTDEWSIKSIISFELFTTKSRPEYSRSYSTCWNSSYKWNYKKKPQTKSQTNSKGLNLRERYRLRPKQKKIFSPIQGFSHRMHWPLLVPNRLQILLILSNILIAQLRKLIWNALISFNLCTQSHTAHCSVLTWGIQINFNFFPIIVRLTTLQFSHSCTNYPTIIITMYVFSHSHHTHTTSLTSSSRLISYSIQY